MEFALLLMLAPRFIVVCYLHLCLKKEIIEYFYFVHFVRANTKLLLYYEFHRFLVQTFLNTDGHLTGTVSIRVAEYILS